MFNPPKPYLYNQKKHGSEERENKRFSSESGHHRSMIFTKQISLFEDEKVGLRVVEFKPAMLTWFVPAPGAQRRRCFGVTSTRAQEGGGRLSWRARRMLWARQAGSGR